MISIHPSMIWRTTRLMSLRRQSLSAPMCLGWRGKGWSRLNIMSWWDWIDINYWSWRLWRRM